MPNLAWDFTGKFLVGLVLYCILTIVLAAIFLPLAIIPTGIIVYLVIKDGK